MHTNTSSQKNQHRDILAKKKKKIHKQTQTEKQKKRQIGACDWSYGSVQLWIGAADRCSCGSMLVIGVVIGAVDRCCCGSMLVIGAVDR